jgi:hypothetical protein
MKTSLWLIALLAILSLPFSACSHIGNGHSSSTASSEEDPLLASAPAGQKRFCAVITKYSPPEEVATSFVTGQMNEMQTEQFHSQMSDSRADRKAEIVSLLGSGNVEHWTGKIVSVHDVNAGNLAVILDVGCDARFEAVAFASGLTAQTLIPKSSSLYAVAHTLKEDQQVTFSGHLIPGASLPDGYQELSAGDLPSLQEPRFNFYISKLNASK